ncbi:diguanylate cyclase (GGDEF)-like protein [Aneurinibacillus soli]|uniref:Phytochrome-like protein cph2 n=1 Tax=Aneurinibacillus soli TaxID=1500254 RepID=A0A0U4WH03_9BACL|nr:EAL domain-containing protein [Aneurinibacillus soli]PYE64012.1 diguanylate cyclase (GGDEF)-like protein [Aneurinibacillus soli]BAU27961.1 Phytochrome-like protein cph2 [Aneurinibacillus soli]
MIERLERKQRKSEFISFLAILVFVIVRFFHEQFYRVYDAANYLGIHTLLELFSIIVGFSISLQGWVAFPYASSKRRLLFGGAFFAVATIDLFHTLFYKDMPVLVTESSMQKAAWFWIIARITESISFLCILMIKDGKENTYWRKWIYLFSFVYTSLIIFVVIKYGNYLPMLVNEETGTTLLKSYLEYFVIFLHLTTLVFILLEYKKTRNVAVLSMSSAIIFLLLSEWNFTFYKSVYDFDNVFGHIYKFLGYYFLLEAIYVTSVKEPYLRQVETEKMVNHLAYHDSLTDLPNRLLFNERIRTALMEYEQQNKNFAVFFFDLDRFKHVNDSLGHSIGDLLLQTVAKRLKECIKEPDIASRLGGDEFTILLVDMESMEDLEKKAQAIVDRLSEPYQLNGHEIYMTISMGISLYPEHGQTYHDLIMNADTALYYTKQTGRNGYTFYNNEMNEKSREKLSLGNDLHKALLHDNFLLYYQPQVDVQSGQIIGAEALIRWKHPEKGFISPAEFIPLAEENGLILQMGEWVLRTACQQNKAWQDAGYEPIRMSVNLSMHQFQQKNFIESILRTLEETGLQANYLELEVTESIAMYDIENVIKKLDILDKAGIHVSVDDFGTGYSSLNYLRRLPVHTLKIDQSFVRDINIDWDDTAIVNSIITLAHTLRMNVVAEGVETQEQFAFLKEHGCDRIQGYLVSPPVPAGQFEQLVKKTVEGVTL